MDGFTRHKLFWSRTTHNAGRQKIKNGVETFEFLKRKMKGDNPFYFIRLSDVDSHLIAGRTNKRMLQEKDHEISEFFSEELREELKETFALQDDSVTFAEFDYRLNPWNYYCFSCGLYEHETFIPFLKESFSNSLFLCDDVVNGNELIQKMFSVSTFKTLPPKAYFYLDDEYEKILELAKSHREIVGAIGFSTKIIAKRLLKDGINVKFIDLGSCVDVLAGNASRPFFRKMVKNKLPLKWKELYNIYCDAFEHDRESINDLEFAP